MTYKQKQELAQLPAIIEALEKQIAQIHEAMAMPEFYQQPGEAIAAEQKQLEQLEGKLAASYESWEILEAIDE